MKFLLFACVVVLTLAEPNVADVKAKVLAKDAKKTTRQSKPLSALQFSVMKGGIDPKDVKTGAKFCPKTQKGEKQDEKNHYKAVTAICLGFFFGGLGADRFYYGYWAIGAVKIMLWFFICISSCVSQIMILKSGGQKSKGVLAIVALSCVASPAMFGWWIADMVLVGQYKLFPQQPGSCVIPL